ncbi:MAG: hypothetical protein ACRD82_05950, partial [Blastocatellia bacterium]
FLVLIIGTASPWLLVLLTSIENPPAVQGSLALVLLRLSGLSTWLLVVTAVAYVIAFAIRQLVVGRKIFGESGEAQILAVGLAVAIWPQAFEMLFVGLSNLAFDTLKMIGAAGAQIDVPLPSGDVQESRIAIATSVYSALVINQFLFFVSAFTNVLERFLGNAASFELLAAAIVAMFVGRLLSPSLGVSASADVVTRFLQTPLVIIVRSMSGFATSKVRLMSPTMMQLSAVGVILFVGVYLTLGGALAMSWQREKPDTTKYTVEQFGQFLDREKIKGDDLKQGYPDLSTEPNRLAELKAILSLNTWPTVLASNGQISKLSQSYVSDLKADWEDRRRDALGITDRAVLRYLAAAKHATNLPDKLAQTQNRHHTQASSRYQLGLVQARTDLD